MATYTRGQGTVIIWADNADFNPAANTSLGTTENYQLDLTSLASGSARMGAKGDFGENRAGMYAVFLRWESDGSAPTAGGAVDVYWSPSISATAANDNPGGVTGSDGAWPADGAEDEWALQLNLIGSLIVTNDASTVMIQCINPAWSPPTRYGSPVVDNNTSQAHLNDAVEAALYFVPITEAVA